MARKNPLHLIGERIRFLQHNLAGRKHAEQSNGRRKMSENLMLSKKSGNHLWLIFLLTAVILLLGSQSVVPSDQQDGLEARIDEYISAYNSAYGESGELINGTILIARKGNILVHKGYGYADFDQGINNGTQTVYRIASISKPITALAVMQLEEEGKLDLHDPLSRYLPEASFQNEISIHQLLTHTAGIRRDPLVGLYDPISLEHLVKHIQSVPLVSSPGTQVQYSNCGYQLLAYLIERVSGQSYSAYLEEHIFTPAGMDDSGISLSTEESESMAKGYRLLAGSLVAQPAIDMSVVTGSGSIYATAEDLYQLDRALEGGALVKQQTRMKIFQDQTALDGDIRYGYGWEIADWKGLPLFHHGGYLISGYSGEWLKIPNHDLVVIVLNNTPANNLFQVAKVLAAITMGDFYSLPIKADPIQLDPGVLLEYEGEYQLVGEEIPVSITSRGQRLQVTTPMFEGDFLPYSDTGFFSADNPETRIIFSFDRDRNAVGFELIDPLSRMECIRVGQD
jgi:CubicO group peptidase (beta-lactamase class C family)